MPRIRRNSRHFQSSGHLADAAADPCPEQPRPGSDPGRDRERRCLAPEGGSRIERVLIAGNWKMFKTQAETRAFCESFSPPAGVDVVICPPATSLAAAVESGM